MEKKEFYRYACEMIYLTRCIVNDRLPDADRINKSDLGSLYEVCRQHALTACTAYALESIGIHDHNFSQAKEKALRKNILLDTERNIIFSRFEAEHIWYMPLKGSVIKDIYPRMSMRQMSDNDILIDDKAREKTRRIMTERGFELKAEYENVDEFSKNPVYNFEMHTGLFRDKIQNREIYEYFRDIKKRLVKDENNSYGYHFTNEDFYIYMITHEYKHFISGGTGVRSLLDTYLFVRRYGKTLDKKYIYRELEKIGVAEFEANNRRLAVKLFSGQKLSDDERKLLAYYIFSGTYGTYKNVFENKFSRMNKSSKTDYIFRRIFPDMEYYKRWYPLAYRYKVLIPFAWIFRSARALITKRKKTVDELNFVRNRK